MARPFWVFYQCPGSEEGSLPGLVAETGTTGPGHLWTTFLLVISGGSLPNLVLFIAPTSQYWSVLSQILDTCWKRLVCKPVASPFGVAFVLLDFCPPDFSHIGLTTLSSTSVQRVLQVWPGLPFPRQQPRSPGGTRLRQSYSSGHLFYILQGPLTFIACCPVSWKIIVSHICYLVFVVSGGRVYPVPASLEHFNKRSYTFLNAAETAAWDRKDNFRILLGETQHVRRALESREECRVQGVG